MIRQQLESYLGDADYYSIPTTLTELSAFVKVENNFLNIIQIIDYEKGLYLSPDQYIEMKEAIKTIFQDRGMKDIHIMSLVLFDDYEKAKAFVQEDRFCWFIDTESRELVIEENRTPDFYGLKVFLEEFLTHYTEQEVELKHLLSEEETKTSWKRLKQYLLDMPKVTVSIVLLNIIIYFVCIFAGNALYELGQIGNTYINSGEYYRLLTAIFLHAGLDHLFSNMLLLYFIGDMMEKALNSKKFLVVYLIAGIMGNVISCLYEMMTNTDIVSVGASGAIFGLIGGMLFLVLRKNNAIKIPVYRMLIMIVYCIYSSFVGDNINVPAHFGGLIFGFLITWILNCRREKSEG